MRTLSHPLLALAAIAFALVGCNEKTPPGPETAAPPDFSSNFQVRISKPPSVLESEESVTPADMQKQAEANLQAHIAIDRAVAGATDWREADEKVRAVLSDEALDAPNYVREQIAAAVMLQKQLLSAAPSPERQKATAFYTDLLVENGNTQAPVIAKALKELQGYWNQARIAEAASKTLEKAQAQVERQDTESSASSKLTAELHTTNEQARQLSEAEQAMRELQAMSQ